MSGNQATSWNQWVGGIPRFRDSEKVPAFNELISYSDLEAHGILQFA